MGNSAVALVFVLTVNVLMFLVSAAISDLNPESTIQFYSGEGMLIEGKNSGTTSSPVLDVSDSTIKTELPEGEENIISNLISIVTDTFNSIRAWFGKITGFTYLYGILAAPYSILKATTLPAPFVFAVGSMWYLYTMFIVVSFVWGRE